MNRTLRRFVLLCTFAATAGAQQPEPKLPPGLAPPPKPPEEKKERGPALPPGLERPSGPVLPPGLEPRPADVAEETPETKLGRGRFSLDLHGFWEARGGLRLQNDPAQPRDAILGETRFQLETAKTWGKTVFEYMGDIVLDGVLEEADFDLRRLRLTVPIGDTLDLRIGRQVLTWGTGDLIFINDLFPKDWNSFLIGRDVEYLKAPSDAIRLGWFPRWFNVDLVYSPRFNADRFITGDRVSFWSPLLGRRAGRDNQVHFDSPDDRFEDDEWAVRVYRTFGATEVALYGYSGYWKSPAGQRLIPLRATFPKLNVYGASVRGTIGKGIANAEIGYYDSREDRAGGDPFTDNSEVRVLLGYEREIGKEFTASVQYYLVHILGYNAYRNTLPGFLEPRDRDRHVVTLRLTKLLMNQDLTLSSFLFYSPSDGDGYWRPNVTYKVSDDWRVEAGANVFFGEADHTFYAQFADNSNVYIGIRRSF